MNSRASKENFNAEGHKPAEFYCAQPIGTILNREAMINAPKLGQDLKLDGWLDW